jgi:CheY-like chemotaxis protein
LLIAEDSEVYALMLRQAFETMGVEVSMASSVTGALAAIDAGTGPGRAGAFDLVLCDLNLADGTLFEVLDGLDQRRSADRAVPPVIGMSASLEEDAVERAHGRGVRHMLAKDSDAQAFAQRVRKAYAFIKGGAKGGKP